MKNHRTKVALVFSILLGCVGIAYAQVSAQNFECKPNGVESPVQTLRNFFWVATGFPGANEYACFHEENAGIKALVGSDGLIGRINSIRDTVVNAIVATGQAAQCADVPTTGTIQMSATETLTFGVASRKPPTNFPLTETYHKKVVYSNSSNSRVADFEFHCGRASMMVKVTETLGNGPQTMVVFYDGERSSTNSSKYITFFLRDQGNFEAELNLGLSLVVNDNGKYDIWMARSGLNAINQFAGYRFTAAGNSNASQLSLHYHDVSNDGLTNANYTSATDIDSDGVVGAVAPKDAGSNPAQQAQGCAASYNTITNNITSDALCPGLSPAQHPRDTLTSGSKMSMRWMQESFPSWVSGL